MLSIGTVSSTIINGTFNTAELVCVQTNPVSIPKDSVIVLLFGYMTTTVAAGSTFMNLRTRQGTAVTGAQVGITSLVAVTPGAQMSLSIMTFDVPIAGANNQWCMTIQMTAAGANCNIQSASFAAIFLS